jgi:DNA repair photolyase
VEVKTNAARLLKEALAAMKPAVRQRTRILMSGSTDPYQPLERQQQLTRQCLEVFARYPDLDLLLVQTRSPLAERDLPLLQDIPYAWLSVTIETDDQAYLKTLKGGPLLSKRWELVRRACEAGIRTQIAVSPCLAYSGVESFGQQLLQSGAHRLIVDSLLAGDGADGQRSARSPFAKVEPDWANTSHAYRLYDYLREKAEGTGIAVGWSSAGFSGIPPRRPTHAEVTVPGLW